MEGWKEARSGNGEVKDESHLNKAQALCLTVLLPAVHQDCIAVSALFAQHKLFPGGSLVNYNLGRTTSFSPDPPATTPADMTRHVQS